MRLSQTELFIIDMEMKNLVYRHKKTGNLYKVVESEAEMKDIKIRDWKECVIYRSLSIPSKIYVREKSDFKKKFEVCEEAEVDD